MLVCHCQRVTDAEIRLSARCGLASVSGTCRVTGAGTGCGGCRPLVRELVKTELCEREPAGAASSA